MDQVQQLFEDFQHYRKQTANFQKLRATIPYLRDLKLSDPRRSALSKMVRWCTQKELDSRWWLYSLFQARRWIAAPRWEQLVPGTKKTEVKAIARYVALKEAPLYAERVSQETRAQQEAQGQVYDPNRDLSNTVENIKRRYLDASDSERCMREMSTVTLGYHPKSQVCVSCPSTQICVQQTQAQVPFDIVALRRGDLSVDQAKRITGRPHYGSR